MGPAIPLIGAGLGLADTLIGSSQQGKANSLNDQQSAELLRQQQIQDAIRQSVYGRIQSQPQGNPENPFSQQYARPIPNLPGAAPAPPPQENPIQKILSRLKLPTGAGGNFGKLGGT